MTSQPENNIAAALSTALAEKYRQALALHQQGQLGQAEALYKEILQAQPQHFDALHMLGVAAGQRGDSQAAVELLSQAIAVRPDHAATYADRGIALHSLGRLGNALASFDQALVLQSDYPVALNCRGVVLQALKRPDEALASYDRALALQPHYVEALINRGGALQDLGRYQEAVISFDRALVLVPDRAELHCSRGSALRTLKRFEEALASFDRALVIQPDYVDAHVQRSLASLLVGDLRQGWEDYEWRWQLPALRPQVRSMVQPRWRGTESIVGKTIFVYAEQGLGDTILFCRYACLLAVRGAKVVLEVQPVLKTLLSQLAGVSSLIGTGDLRPEFDFHCPLLSLPLAFGTDLSSIPAAQRYLVPDEQRVAAWQARLGIRTGTRIGLVWAGNPAARHDHTRSIPLKMLTRLAVPGVQLISLQKDLPDGDRELLATHSQILHLGDELTDFADTAAVMANLDLVISVDTAGAHLAGALGRPVWILHRFAPTFPWLPDGEDSPWYPSARLFRQTRFADWDSVMDRVELALRQMV